MVNTNGSARLWIVASWLVPACRMASCFGARQMSCRDDAQCTVLSGFICIWVNVAVGIVDCLLHKMISCEKKSCWQ